MQVATPKLPHLRPALPAWLLLLVSATFCIVMNNGALFRAFSERATLFSAEGGALLLSFYLLMITALSIVFFLLAYPYTLKPVLIFFLCLSAVLSYFSHDLGVLLDVGMIRNIAENIRDRNHQEAHELLSFSLILHVCLFGLLPSLLVGIVRPLYCKFTREMLLRVAASVTLLALLGGLVWANFRYSAFFLRENREIRVYTIPFYPIYALERFAREQRRQGELVFKTLGEDARQEKADPARVVGIMVVGETARADHFSLNGYERKTNPLLEEEQLVNFSHAVSAGTSTAYSVPAMFSFLPEKDYSPGKAHAQSNVLDVLSRAGVHVAWIENNSSPKGVADRLPVINLRKNPDPAAPLYSDGGYFDEALVGYFDKILEEASGDVLIVLHTMGSHGPTYHKRYPAAHAQFVPDCQSESPQECDEALVVNAYDNTILYTDFVLDGLIEYLKAHASAYESFLVYASDHGESLGEDGLYLHGLPNFLAPPAQTHIPMLAWFSESYAQQRGVHAGTGVTSLDTAVTHANLPHLLLGLLDVKTSLYQAPMDALAALRNEPPPAP